MSLPPSNSEPTSSSSFELLHPLVRKWIWDQGWNELHDIQETSIRAILQTEDDILISAATARGKTEAAFLPICSAITNNACSSVRALYISPLKALINDQFGRLECLCQDLQIPVHRWHGDVDAGKKRSLLHKPSGILLITPESLEALFILHGPQLAGVFQGLTSVVVDELHSFIGTERGRQLQSLLHRVELLLKRKVRRIALSATLSDMPLAASFLRSEPTKKVKIIESRGDGQEIRILLKGYREKYPDVAEGITTGDEGSAGRIDIAKHLFKTLRGTTNLIFCNTRQNVEIYADLLRRFCEKEKLPNEFLPHHGNISKDLREEVEAKVKERSVPLNIVCTTTLELGIDIGAVTSIAQIGTPFTVCSIRQRLGRSGRRGNPAILRLYIQEPDLTEASFQDQLRPQIVQSVAMINLLVKRWYEPPVVGALHLSTLIQQLLSAIAQYGGMSAVGAWHALCETGPFADVDQKMFMQVLRSLKIHELISQSADGTILLDLKGERLVNHYSFYSAFSTPEEYKLFAEDKLLGTIPIDYPLSSTGMYLIFAGRRWTVTSVDVESKCIYLSPAAGGRPPCFSGSGGLIDDRIREEMFSVYLSNEIPVFLDATAKELLREGRLFFHQHSLSEKNLIRVGKDTLLLIWKGDRVLNTITILLKQRGLAVSKDGVAITVHDCSPEDLAREIDTLQKEGPYDPVQLASAVDNKSTEKHDIFLSDALLCANYASRYIDIHGGSSALFNIIKKNE